MRQIKFRGKHIHDYSVLSGEWVYGDLLHTNDGLPHIHQIETDSYFEIISATVGQYTGLKDKNGHSIYEGDILLVNNSTKAYVVWRNEGFDILDIHSWTPTSRGDIEGFVYARENKLEITGNIHDNPELLKNK